MHAYSCSLVWELSHNVMFDLSGAVISVHCSLSVQVSPRLLAGASLPVFALQKVSCISLALMLHRLLRVTAWPHR